MKKFKYLKFSIGNPSICEWCPTKTNSILIYPDGSESWCCPIHALKIGKIKRLREHLKHYTKKRKSLKISNNSFVKSEKQGVLVLG